MVFTPADGEYTVEVSGSHPDFPAIGPRITRDDCQLWALRDVRHFGDMRNWTPRGDAIHVTSLGSQDQVVVEGPDFVKGDAGVLILSGRKRDEVPDK